MIEKKIPFSEEKFKRAAEICIHNELPNVNHQDNGENVSRGSQRLSQQPLPSQAQRPRRKKKMVLWAGSRAPLQCADLGPCIPTAPAVTKRGRGTAQAVISGDVSPNYNLRFG